MRPTKVGREIKMFDVRDGILFRYTEEDGVTEVRVPEGVTQIGQAAFARCTKITSVYIPEGVTSIAIGGFWRCTGLKSVVFPKSMEKIEFWVFTDCRNLTEIVIDGMKFDVIPGETVIDNSLFELVREHNYSVKLANRFKYSIIFQMCFYDVFGAEGYIKEHLKEMLNTLIDSGNNELIQRILDSSKFINKENIDEYIEYAITEKQSEIYVTLVNYKNERYGYEEIEDRFKL